MAQWDVSAAAQERGHIFESLDKLFNMPASGNSRRNIRIQQQTGVKGAWNHISISWNHISMSVRFMIIGNYGKG